MAADNADQLKELFRQQAELGRLWTRSEEYRELAQAQRDQLRALEKDNPAIAGTMRAEHEKTIADYDKLAADYAKMAQALDSKLVAEWKENSHLMGGLTKEQAQELADHQAKTEAAQRAREEQAAKAAEAAAQAKAQRDAEAKEKADREQAERVKAERLEQLQRALRERDERLERDRARDKAPER